MLFVPRGGGGGGLILVEIAMTVKYPSFLELTWSNNNMYRA